MDETPRRRTARRWDGRCWQRLLRCSWLARAIAHRTHRARRGYDLAGAAASVPGLALAGVGALVLASWLRRHSVGGRSTFHEGHHE